MKEKDVFELSMEPKWREDTKRAYTTILSMGDKVKVITEEDAIRLLDGAVDIHVHSIPDPEIDVGWDQLEIAKKCMKIGVKKIVITHPNWNVTKATHEQMAEMGKMGAYIGLFMYGDVPNFNNPNCDPMEMFEIIRKVGPEHIVLASDLGTVINMPPWEGIKLFMRLMIANGVPEKDIRRMCSENPKYLLGIN